MYVCSGNLQILTVQYDPKLGQEEVVWGWGGGRGRGRGKSSRGRLFQQVGVPQAELP